jgi:lipoate-protein ligase A
MSAVNAKKVFARINDALVAGLRILGVMAEWGHFKTRAQVSSGPCFAQIDLGEITIGGRKLIASAQRIFERCLLQQGTMPLYEAPVDLVRYLILDRRNLTRNRIAELATHLGEHIGREFNMDSIVDGFRRAFEDAFGAPSGPVEDLHEWFQRNKRQYASV